MLRIPAVFLASAALLCGCGLRDGETKQNVQPRFENVAAVSYQGFAAGERGGRFVSALVGGGPETFNTALASDPVGLHLAALMNASLVRRNQMSLEWEPCLARRWVISADGRRITFHLREGLKWSDGEPMGADDWELVSRVASAPGVRGDLAHRLSAGAETARFVAVDDLTVRLDLPVPYSGAFEIAAVFPLPAHVLGPVFATGVKAFNDYWNEECDVTSVLSSGPFVISRFHPGDSLVMGPNPYYSQTDAAGGALPYLDEYVIRFAKDCDEAAGMFYSGTVDHFLLRGGEIDVAASMKENLDIELYDAGPDTEILVMVFNQNPAAVTADSEIGGHELAWFGDRGFRRALCHLLNREVIIEETASGYGYPAVTSVPQFSPYYWKGADRAAPGYDPEKAGRLLKKSGFLDRDGNGIREDKSGKEVSLILRTNEDNGIRRKICDLFAAEARKAGIAVRCVFEPFNALVTRLVSSYDWELALIGIEGDIDPVDQGMIFLSSGSLHLIEPSQEYARRDWEVHLDAAWTDAAAAYDEQLKKRAFERVQRICLYQAPWVNTYAPAVVHAFRRKWENVFPRSASGHGLCAILPRIYERREP
ncbi:MAG: hypothetical protein JW852_08895 [Spirochaetales bacterium]|nr:hypothetical protein [Spirochaetales bacterium]